MAKKPKACRKCRFIHNQEKCPKCNSTSNTEGWKGKIEILDPNKSEIAEKLKLVEKGVYAIKSE